MEVKQLFNIDHSAFAFGHEPEDCLVVIDQAFGYVAGKQEDLETNPTLLIEGLAAQRVMQLVAPLEAQRIQPWYAGRYEGKRIFGLHVSDELKQKLLADGFIVHQIREYFKKHMPRGTGLLWEMVARAIHLGSWFPVQRHCHACGGSLKVSETETAMQCSACGNTVYPRINPAIIVAVRKGNKLLLARNVERRTNFLSVLAGYCEAGESIEQTVLREVKEEAGIEVDNIQYIESMSWPFSQSLMLGFIAEWKSGELVADTREIADAAWYDIDALPETPPPPSMAWKLIEYIKKSRA